MKTWQITSKGKVELEKRKGDSKYYLLFQGLEIVIIDKEILEAIRDVIDIFLKEEEDERNSKN